MVPFQKQKRFTQLQMCNHGNKLGVKKFASMYIPSLGCVFPAWFPRVMHRTRSNVSAAPKSIHDSYVYSLAACNVWCAALRCGVNTRHRECTTRTPPTREWAFSCSVRFTFRDASADTGTHQRGRSLSAIALSM